MKCKICKDFGFYTDKNGVWHKCPRCEKKVIENVTPYKWEPSKPSGIIYTCEADPNTTVMWHIGNTI